MVVKPEGRFNTYFFPLCVAPQLLNIFLVLNYAFSSVPVTETYEYNNVVEKGKNGRVESTTTITLPNNIYDRFPGIRVFMNYDEMVGSSAITYTFETGLFGIRVMKDYKFE